MSLLPRILFLTCEAPHTQAAGSIAFYRLFGDYPPDRLCVVTNHLPPSNASRLSCCYHHLPLLADRLNRTRFWPWKTILRSLGAGALVQTRRVDRVLGDFNPDIVVSLMQDSWVYDLAGRFARRRRLPLVLFVHDLPGGFEPVPKFLIRRQRNLDQRIFRQAAVRLCVSTGMVDWFKQEFDLPSQFLLPPRNATPPQQGPQRCRVLKNPGHLTLGYAGGLHYGYGEQLLRLLPVLRETRTRLEIFGPKPAGVVAALTDATDVIHFHGYAATPTEAWRTLLERCDAIIQPYLNPAGKHERQYRTHFPSKLGDCLSLGLPLIITGPSYASGLAWCRESGDVALTITEDQPDVIAAHFNHLRDNEDLRVELATRARTASGMFDLSKARIEFENLLKNICHE